MCDTDIDLSGGGGGGGGEEEDTHTLTRKSSHDRSAKRRSKCAHSS